MRIGISDMTGPVCSMPTRSAPQPHWKTATSTPKAAPTDSRKPSAALTGTRIERKTTSSRSTARPMTTVR
jgi:hypothetical protein